MEELQSCQIDKIKEICRSFNNAEGELINVLHKTQETFGYLPESVQRLIAAELNISAAQVYGVVSFYTFFTMKPKGKFPISICLGTACYVRGAEDVVDEFKKALDIKVGEVTPDGKFSLDCLRCVGACGLAPVVLIGDKVHGRLEANQVKELLAQYE
ncbi:MAG: NAD(P)H-dependent oxidoreductase subunit E [Prevotellaceae bacterium]|jgi:NADH-quinone oxidoreductase subunit E/NADP-reducing hydrogenase subunit HndA|nr:NAD(P)H-dependent oxidoreductase subunit E [Prevotellaceae bacterium]